MTSRIHRGFHRIGVVLAVPVLLVAGALAGHEAWAERSTREALAAFEKAPPQTDAFERMMSTPRPIHVADYAVPFTMMLAALAFYAAARAVGWVLAGFISPGHRA